MRSVGIGLSCVLLVGWWTRAPAQDGGVDFRLPFSGGREVIRSSTSAPGPRDLFNQKYGKAAGVVFWDEKLETPRFISPRAKLTIARPDATESELIESARNFVDADSRFFGVTGKDLIDPAVLKIRRHALVIFGQAVGGVEIRGANVRVLIGPEGELASVDAFLIREPALPEPSYIDENFVINQALQLPGIEIGALERQVIFPSNNPSSARFGYCVEALGPEEGDAHELFFSDQGEPLGMVDPSHGFCEVPLDVTGFSTNPDDIFKTADKADDFYPVPSAKVATMNWNGLSDDRGDTTICILSDPETVWSELVLGTPVGPQRGCAVGNGKPNLVRPEVQIFHGDHLAGQLFVPVNLFDPNAQFFCGQSIHLKFNPNASIAGAFHLLVYHNIHKLHQEWSRRMKNLRLERFLEASVPLQVLVDDALEASMPRYHASEVGATLRIAPMMGDPDKSVSWVPPTIVHHEYAHHIINAVVQADQNDGFVEGVADAITVYLNQISRIGFVKDDFRGNIGFDVEESLEDDDLKGLDEQERSEKVMRRRIGRTFWRILSKALGTRDEGQVTELLYFWMSLRHVYDRNQIAFDGSKVLLEQLLVADDSLSFEGGHGDGNILNGTPRQEFIVEGFKDDDWGLFRTPFVRGDVDRDGSIDLSDAVILLSYLFLGGADGYRCPVAMDVDDNEAIELTDAINLLSYQFLGGAKPQPPFPGCGTDPTRGLYWCVEESTACRQ